MEWMVTADTIVATRAPAALKREGIIGQDCFHNGPGNHMCTTFTDTGKQCCKGDNGNIKFYLVVRMTRTE